MRGACFNGLFNEVCLCRSLPSRLPPRGREELTLSRPLVEEWSRELCQPSCGKGSQEHPSPPRLALDGSLLRIIYLRCLYLTERFIRNPWLNLLVNALRQA